MNIGKPLVSGTPGVFEERLSYPNDKSYRKWTLETGIYNLEIKGINRSEARACSAVTSLISLSPAPNKRIELRYKMRGFMIMSCHIAFPLLHCNGYRMIEPIPMTSITSLS